LKRFEMEVAVPDKPGQLVRVLKPLSEVGGNVVSITHLRENGEARVHIIFEAEEEAARRFVKKVRELDGVKVLSLGGEPRFETDVVLIGHIVDTDIKDTIDRINSVPGARVADVDLEMPDPEKESSAGFTVMYEREEALEDVVKTVEEIAEEKNLAVILPLEVIQRCGK